jgi:hypothetical protein
VEGDNAVVEDVFVFEPSGMDEAGVVTGTFRATGVVPQFLADQQGQVDTNIFES